MDRDRGARNNEQRTANQVQIQSPGHGTRKIELGRERDIMNQILAWNLENNLRTKSK